MIHQFFKWLKWRRQGKPCVSYEGYHCGLCGAWVGKPFTVPEYKSAGKQGDAWGICDKCIDEFTWGKSEMTEKELRDKIGVSEKGLIDSSSGLIDIFGVRDDKVSYGFLSNGKIVTEGIDVFIERFSKEK